MSLASAGSCVGCRQIELPRRRPPRAARATAAVAATQQSLSPATPTGLRVLITGGTKGLGLALADGFLAGGDCCVVSSRDAARVDAAVGELRARHGASRAAGRACDVRSAAALEELTAFAADAMGGVDVVICNAGSNGYEYAPLAEADPVLLEEAVGTNLLGSLLSSRAAIRLLRAQPRGGAVFLLEGAGSDGAATRLLAAYGATKAALPQLAKTLAEETAGTPVRVHTISPGIVFTELVSAGRFAFGPQGRFFVNCVAEPPDVAAAAVVPRVRELLASGARSGAAIRVLTPQVLVGKLLRRLLAGENRDRFYAEARSTEDDIAATGGGGGAARRQQQSK